MSSPMDGQHEQDSYKSEYSDGTLLYIVCVAVDIPPEKISVLEDVILESRKGLREYDSNQTGETESVHSALYVIDPTQSSAVIQRGSRVPMQEFTEWPFVGMSLEEIYNWFRSWTDELVELNPGEEIKYPTALHHFAVFDERTLKDGTLLLCSDSVPRIPIEEDQDKEAIKYSMEGDSKPVPENLTTVRCDAYSSVVNLSCSELHGPHLQHYELLNKKNRQFVYTKQYQREMDLEYQAGVQAKVARGEPLRDIEKEITGLQDSKE